MKLLSTARFLPERELSNDELRARFGREQIDKWEKATGILRRFRAPREWATSDLALPAARQALQRAGLGAGEVDLLVMATDTPDHLTPATSTVLQHKLGAVKAGTFDVGCACASFPTSIALASSLMATQPWVRNALVVGAYLMSKLAADDDPAQFFYGDGSSAVVLQASAEPGLISSALRADGSHAGRWGVFAGGTAEPASVAAVQAGRTNVRLHEAYPAEVNDDGWPLLVQQLCERGRFDLEDLELIFFTQVRGPTIDGVMRRLGLPVSRAPKVMDRFGYTGSACIGMALDDALERGVARPGQLVALVGSGVGFNQAAVAMRL
ncbi:MAG: ketoacyl-ACP synthase III [Myxococcaceae bacterium]